MCIELVMPSSHLILCRPLLLLPPIPPSIRVFSNESALHMRWPKYWSFSLSISPSKEHPGLSPLGRTGWISLQSKGLSRVFSSTTVQKQLYKKYNDATIKQRLQLTYFTKEKETHWGSFQNAICKHLRTQQSWF